MSATMAARARTGASLSAPVRKPQQAARRKSTPWIARVLRSAAQSPGRALILLAFGLASAAILANALMFQKARHPHPMMTYAPPGEAPRAPQPVRRTEAAPETPAPLLQAQPGQAQANLSQPTLPALPPTRPSDLSQAPAARESAPRPPAAVSAVARMPAAAPAAQRPAPVRDPIAELINGGDLRPPAEVGGRQAAPRRGTTN
jgi:hypothetical protein